jgi:uncharacterized protein
MTQTFQFEEVIRSRHRLREIIKEPSRFVSGKVIDHIDEYCRRFIAVSPFAVIASRSAAGAVDLSPKGDPPGFAKVLDEETLAVPDRLGNNRADTLCNLTEDDRLGVIFMVPGKSETLRVSGTGMIVRDSGLNDRLAHKGKRPNLAIVIKVERAFFHCSKCMIRSSLWHHENWPETTGLPTLAETMVQHGELRDSISQVDEIVQRDAINRLY